MKKMRKNHEEEMAGSTSKITALNQELSKLKISAAANNQQAAAATAASNGDPGSSSSDVKVEPEEHKKVLKQLEARSEELIGVMEERSSLRKELVNQREK